MSVKNNIKKVQEELEQQFPGRASDIIEKKVGDDVDGARTVFKHLDTLVVMLTDFLIKVLGGSNPKEKEEAKGDFRADTDDTPQGTSK